MKRLVSLSVVSLVALTTFPTLNAQQQSPLFRGGANAVQLDVRVLDGSGRIVRDLRADEFRVFEDGKPQTLTSFQFVDVAARTAAAGAPASPAASTGRYYLLVIDDQPIPARSVQFSPHASSSQPGILVDPSTSTLGIPGSRFRIETIRAIAREFVTQHLAPLDHVALATTSGRAEIIRNFGSSRTDVLRAVDGVEAAFGPDSRPMTLLDTLRTLADWLGQIPGQRKAMVVLSERAFGGAGLLQRSSELRDLVVAANRANVALYTIDPVGAPSGPVKEIKPVVVNDGAEFDVDRMFALDDLASLTNGFTLTGSNDFVGALDRIVEESSRYYLLAYTSTDSRNDDRFRSLRVEVTRPGVKVQSRAGYVAKQRPRKVEPLG